MKSERRKHIAFVVTFLVIIFVVPGLQAVLDVAEDDEIQALELFEEAPTEEHLRTFEDDLEENSFFEQSLRPAFQLVRYFATGDLGQKALVGKNDWYFYHPGVKYLTQPYFRDLPPDPKLGDPIATIVDFRDQLKSKGIHLIVVPIPGKASVYPERLAKSATEGKIVYAHTERFRKELSDRGIETIDIHEVFRKGRVQADEGGESLYMRTDTHWTGAGVKLAAEAIAKRIEKEPWFLASRTATTADRYARRKVKVARRGDVLEMSKLPLREELFSVEQVDCYQIVKTSTETLYEDDPKSPVLVLGDSFSRVFQTDEPKSAGVIANLAYELQMPLASIVNDGGASTLVRQQLARSVEVLEGKRLVIWEFIERDIRFGMQGWQPVPLWPDNG